VLSGWYFNVRSKHNVRHRGLDRFTHDLLTAVGGSLSGVGRMLIDLICSGKLRWDSRYTIGRKFDVE
jgi:hypothetical protein